jgi:peptidoglycan hydrolase CwlO-like protein
LKRRLLITFLAASVGASSMIGLVDNNRVHAASDQDQLQSIEEKRTQNELDQQNKQAEINKLKEEQNQIQSDIKQYDLAIMETNEKITEKQSEIDNTREVIEELKIEISEIEKRIEERDKLLKGRVRSMYENGGAVSYIEVLLGAKGFGELIDRVISLNLIAEQDKQIIEEHKTDKSALEQKRAKVETELLSLENNLAKLEKLKQELNEKAEQKNQLMNSLKQKEGQLYNEFTSLEEIAENLRAQEAAVRQEMKKEEEERKRRIVNKAASTSSRQSISDTSNSSNSESDKSSTSAGDFIWPTQGRLTSNMGSRWNEFHAGIDIAKSGTVPIVAAASGTVSRSYYSSSYGNVVFISHNVNGQLYTTVYAHMKSRSVSSGESVSQGQVVGYQGNTGMSFGQHLHFELHKGAWNANKSNAVNPLNYLN